MKKTHIYLKFPTQFSQYIQHIDQLEFEGESMLDCLQTLDSTYGQICERLLDGQGKVRPYINLFVGKKNIRSLSGLQTVIPNGERVTLLLSRAGG